MEVYNYCVLCNPEVNWLEVEFRSERNEPITGLTVTITNPLSGQTHQKSAPQGRVLFENIAAAEWVVSVETDTLLSRVEQYASRKENEDSPVQISTEEQTDRCGKPKAYYHVTVGDLWQTLPEDSILIEAHGPSKSNYREDAKGFRTCHNRSSILEVKALRSYMPMIVDTDEFSLVNSYTFALLSQQAYASDMFGIPDDKKPRLPEGGIKTITKQFKLRQKPEYCASTKESWLVNEVPYSESLQFEYFADENIGSEGYILSNSEISIIGVRGTQTYFGNQEIGKLSDSALLKNADMVTGLPVLKISEVTDGVIAALNSPGYQDVVSDISASQIAPSEFGSSYVHQGFYKYAGSLWKLIEDSIKDKHRGKKFYICGHSLGGAGALLLSALIQDAYHPTTLRLYTYGMPRTGTHSFINRYKNIQHYRHVNNHDAVPQVPMRWMNTNPDDKNANTSIWRYFSPVLYIWDSVKERTVDNDEDNYQHHGNLVQLLTYSKNKHHPDPVAQVLLTPWQIHVTSLSLVSNKIDDSYHLADSLSKDNIDINGYIDTGINSALDHMMSEYIPNLKEQLHLLLEDTLDQSYQSAAQVMLKTEQRLIESYQELKISQADALGMQYMARKDPAASAKYEYERSQTLFKIKQEMDMNEKLALNNQRVRKELQALVKDPALLPIDKLLFGDQVLEKEPIKEQLK